MTMTLREIQQTLEHFAPSEYQEDYDNSGLIIGRPDDEVTGVLISLDITEEIIEEAIRGKCNLVISHHPMIFKGLKRITGTTVTERMVSMAIKNGIAIYAMHTNLDNSAMGLNHRFGSLLGLKNCRVLRPGKERLAKLVTFCPVDHAGKVRDALFEAGAGKIGNYDCCSYNLTGEGTFRASENTNPFVGEKNVLHHETETRIEVIFPRIIESKVVTSLLSTHPYEEVAYDIYPLSNPAGFTGSGMIGELDGPVTEKTFLENVKKITGLPVLRHSGLPGKKIFRVAICTVSGAFLISEAKRAGADAFLTADLKYHDFFEAEGKIIITDIGHYESERIAKDLIYDILIKKFPTFAFLISKINTNPVNYY
jgi:dinuclear metal center YbgI/SA1388 family protein